MAQLSDDSNESDSARTGGAEGALLISAGMESSGSGWLFNMVNELLQSTGQTDVRQLQDEYDLEGVLYWDNCNVRDLDAAKWSQLDPVRRSGHTFVVKSHKAPSELAQRLMHENAVRGTYIHRDPRDVIVSVYQRGKKRRANGKKDSFARMRTIYHAIAWMQIRQLPVYRSWKSHPRALIVRYEDLQERPIEVLSAVCNHLGIDASADAIAEVAASFTGDGARQHTGVHYRGGGRRQDDLTSLQTKVSNLVFRHALRDMGYQR